MRKIEITEALLRDGATVYNKGDVVSIEDNKAQQWIDLGWALDPKTKEQGKRIPGARPIKPNSIKQKLK